MQMSSRLKTRLKSQYGPWALVTGASSGIGEAIAIRLAESGLNLVLHGRKVDRLHQLASQISETYGVETQTLAADIGNAAGLAKIFETTEKLDIGLLVATAGYGTSGSWLNADITAETDLLRVNCEATLILTHHFSHRFAPKKRGGIILMGSLVGFQGTPFAAHYAATKAYVQSLAEALSVELKPFGVDVLSAAPGPVASGFADRANMQMGATMKPENIAVPILRALGRKQTVLPGFMTKFLVGSLRMLPRWGKVRVMKLVMGGMTGHQR
jgi:short-subunit dehydrogenase